MAGPERDFDSDEDLMLCQAFQGESDISDSDDIPLAKYRKILNKHVQKKKKKTYTGNKKSLEITKVSTESLNNTKEKIVAKDDAHKSTQNYKREKDNNVSTKVTKDNIESTSNTSENLLSTEKTLFNIVSTDETQISTVSSKDSQNNILQTKDKQDKSMSKQCTQDRVEDIQVSLQTTKENSVEKRQPR